MERSYRIAIAVILSSLVIAPTSLATWRAFGETEPDTSWDRTESRMFLDPDTSPSGSKVYFNVYTSEYPTGPSPNVGALGTRIWAPGTTYFHAFLGVWKDCNKDGYIGSVESAFLDYHASLLSLPNANGETPGASVCPARAHNPLTDLPVHNDGTWVKEFLFLGAPNPCEFRDAAYRSANCGTLGGFTRNPDVLYANNTFVWMDSGEPGFGGEDGSCPINPRRGTFERTGAFQQWADCLAGWRVGTAVNTVDSSGSLGLRFEDPHHPETSSSALNRDLPAHPWNNPYNGKAGLIDSWNPSDPRYEYQPAFTVSDCSQPRKDVRDPTAGASGNGTFNQVGVKAPDGTPAPLVTGQGYLIASANFTDQDGVILGYYGVRPQAGDPTGSYQAGFEDAWDGVYQGRSNGAGASDDERQGDCNHRTNNTQHGAIVNVETDFSEDSSVKTQATGYFTFFDGGRGQPQGDTRVTPEAPTVHEATGTRNWPQLLGYGGTRSFFGGPDWSTNFLYVGAQAVNTDNFQANGRFISTFYARIDPAVITTYGLTLPAVATGKYGSENCAVIGVGAPAQNGWACDPAVWYKNSAGASTMPHYNAASKDPAVRIPLGHVVGETYTLRDVDCYDGYLGGVREEGIEVYASLVQLSASGPCPP